MSSPYPLFIHLLYIYTMSYTLYTTLWLMAYTLHPRLNPYGTPSIPVLHPSHPCCCWMLPYKCSYYSLYLYFYYYPYHSSITTYITISTSFTSSITVTISITFTIPITFLSLPLSLPLNLFYLVSLTILLLPPPAYSIPESNRCR